MDILSTSELSMDHLNNIASVMNTMRQSEDATDVLIEVDGHQFPAHRLVLCAASSYFRAMFSNGGKEAIADRVQLHGVHLSTIKVVLQYIYTGVLITENTTEGLKSILCAAHMLRLESLCNHCFVLLCHEEMLKGCFSDLWTLAEQYDSTTTIKHSIVHYVQNKFSKVAFDDQFLYLTKNQLRCILCTACLNCSTNFIVKAVMSWANYKPQERQDDILGLLELLHLHCLSSEYLVELQEHDLINKNVDLLKLLLKALTKQLQIAESNTNMLSIVRFGEDENGESCVSIYTHGNGTWTKRQLPFALTLAMAVTYYKRHFYFIGGGNTTADSTNAVLKYCLDTNAAHQVAPLEKKKLNVGSTILGDKLFVIGGLTQSGCLSDVEYYSDTTNTWQPVAPTNTPHNFPRVVQNLGHILVVGSKTSSIVELYNPNTDQWTQLSPLPILAKLHWPRVSVFQHKVYSLHENNALYVYNNFRNEWEPVILPQELPPCFGIWNNADQSLPFLIAADEDNYLHKFDPFKKHLDSLCEANDSLQWNWWQTSVISS